MAEYARINPQSVVYRIAETRDDMTHLVPAPEHPEGGRIDRGWFKTSDLIPTQQPTTKGANNMPSTGPGDDVLTDIIAESLEALSDRMWEMVDDATDDDDEHSDTMAESLNVLIDQVQTMFETWVAENLPNDDDQ